MQHTIVANFVTPAEQMRSEYSSPYHKLIYITCTMFSMTSNVVHTYNYNLSCIINLIRFHKLWNSTNFSTTALMWIKRNNINLQDTTRIMTTRVNTRDVPDFGSGSGRSGIRPFIGSPAPVRLRSELWPDLGRPFWCPTEL